MREIEFDFYTAGQAKCQMENVVNRMNTEVLSGFEEVMQELSEAWRGEAGNQFQKIAGIEAEQMRKTVKLLEDADASLQDAILMAKQIEEKTKEIAEIRTY